MSTSRRMPGMARGPWELGENMAHILPRCLIARVSLTGLWGPASGQTLLLGVSVNVSGGG